MTTLNFVSLGGIVVMMGLCWCLSAHRWKMNWRVILGGVALQYGAALLILKTSAGAAFFAQIGSALQAINQSADGAFALIFGPEIASQPIAGLAFKVLPLIIVYSACMAALYHIGLMPLLIRGLGWVMQKTLGTSGAESLAAAANIFVGQNTAPLVARPYLNRMTQSELMTIMVGGFATIAINVMAAYIDMLRPYYENIATDLLAASVISAPGALLAAKILQPEVEEPVTRDRLTAVVESDDVNLFHAVTRGASEGLKIALGVGAMLIAFITLVTVVNAAFGWAGGHVADLTGYADARNWTLEYFCAYAFYPIALCMGFEQADCWKVSELLGLRLVTNEFLAYERLGTWLADGSTVELSERSKQLLIYAMCGFANLGSIGVQIGGLSPVMPDRERDLARIGFRAMLGGTLASFMGACVVGSMI